MKSLFVKLRRREKQEVKEDLVGGSGVGGWGVGGASCIWFSLYAWALTLSEVRLHPPSTALL